jgi:hypothetical protein
LFQKPPEEKYPVGPWLLGLFLFVVCGSGKDPTEKQPRLPSLHTNNACAVKSYKTRVARFFLVQKTKTVKNIPKGHKIFIIDFPLQDPPKFTQIGIFGLKTNYLATLYNITNSPVRKPRIASSNATVVKIYIHCHE